MTRREQTQHPPPPNRTGKRGVITLPDGERRHFTVLDEVRVMQSDLPSKSLHLQLLRFDNGAIEVRLGYYIIGKLERMRGKWVWGQFATLLPLRDFTKLTKLASRRGWFSSVGGA